MGRRLKTKILVSKSLLKPRVQKYVRSRLMNRQHMQKHYYDLGTRKLPEVRGERVRIRRQSQWQPAVTLKKHASQSFIVQTENEQIYRRNRRHAPKTKEILISPQQNETVENVPDSDGERTVTCTNRTRTK